MKKLLFMLAILVAGVANAQLKQEAQYLRTEYTELYSDIRTSAVAEWGTDHRMVTYEINSQAEAYFDLMRSYDSNNWKELNAAIVEWGTDKAHNREVMKKEGWSFSNIRADWRMVKYEYDNQVKSMDY